MGYHLEARVITDEAWQPSMRDDVCAWYYLIFYGFLWRPLGSDDAFVQPGRKPRGFLMVPDLSPGGNCVCSFGRPNVTLAVLRPHNTWGNSLFSPSPSSISLKALMGLSLPIACQLCMKALYRSGLFLQQRILEH